MTIPEIFTFNIHNGLTIYTAVYELDKYRISWRNPDGSIDFIIQSQKLVGHALTLGTWKIVEVISPEPSAQKEKERPATLFNIEDL